MTRTIFVNLPVADVPAAIRFYTAVGFTNDPRFSDETAAAMTWSDTISVMVLSHARWRTFTDRPICAPNVSEVALCLGCDSRAEVDAMTEAAAGAGGTADVNPPQDHGFMYGRSFTDPDGHVLEPMWMDPAVASGEIEPTVAA